MMRKAVAYIAAGLVIGFALGGIPARRELAAVREERDSLQAKLDDMSRPSLLETFLPGLDRQAVAGKPARTETGGRSATSTSAAGQAATRAPEEARPAPQGDVAVIGARDPANRGAVPAQGESAGSQPAAERAQATTDRGERGPERERGPQRGRELLARFDQLVIAQRARSAAARSALIEHAGLEEQELVRLDSAVTRMNGKLAGYGEEVISQAASEQPPSPAQALGLGHDVSGILYEAQKELDAVVGEQSEGVDDSALQIWNYVDLEQWRPYVESQLAGQPAGQASRPGGDGAAGSASAPATK